MTLSTEVNTQIPLELVMLLILPILVIWLLLHEQEHDHKVQTCYSDSHLEI